MGQTSSASLALAAFGAIGVPRMDSRCCAALRRSGAGTFASSIDMTPPLLAGPCRSVDGAREFGGPYGLCQGGYNGPCQRVQWLSRSMHAPARRGTAAAMTPDPGALRAARAELQRRLSDGEIGFAAFN